MPHSLPPQSPCAPPPPQSLCTITTLQVAREDLLRCSTESWSAETGIGIDTWRVWGAPPNTSCGVRNSGRLWSEGKKLVKPRPTMGPRLEEGIAAIGRGKDTKLWAFREVKAASLIFMRPSLSLACRTSHLPSHLVRKPDPSMHSLAYITNGGLAGHSPLSFRAAATKGNSSSTESSRAD